MTPNKRCLAVIAGVIAFWLTLSFAQAEVIGSRPQGCPRAFCGCALSLKLFGKIIPNLNLANNWKRFPKARKAPGMVGAKNGHVLQLKQHVKGNRWLVWTANSCGRRICIQERDIGSYTVVDPFGWTTATLESRLVFGGSR
jgi:hypothetical protein